ncbi:carbohydrate ABC transporter substrate-binding protein (CUT1 family) [Microterricola gilva]|uniref:Carbohydrate ABC transporter substrate-binding protein (CUT1 family) n=1 Tax=Microterricola gilva TaxID=393267 RepID=A0A4Q8ARG1_9MICO|nr:sugar ABC transporter substrate-binding protein [Microterricola gilva]RZU66639.1 carbohydrate ABC transporter substrate-binding protein (CUT1 family) [Microterricola gilva]
MMFSKTKPWRRVAIATVAAATVATLVGCSAQADEPQTDGEISGKITVWTWNAPGEGLRAAIPAFQELHPDVEIDVQDVGNPAIWEKITTGMAAGGSGLADVLNIGIDYMGNYAEKFPDQLVDLRDFGADELAAEFPAGAWKSGSGADGQVYGIPYEVNAAGFFFRKDLFEAAGLEYAGIETWDDLLDAGVVLKEKTGASLFSMDKAGTVGDSAGLFELLINLQGAFYFNADGEITMNGEEGVRALEIIKKANDLGLVEDVPGTWDNLLITLRGERDVATSSSGGWLSGVIESEAPDMAGKWGVSPPKAVTSGGLTGAVNGGTYLSVPSSSPNQATAWAFINFALGTLEGQQLVYDGGGMFPGFAPMLESPGFVAPNEYFGGTEVNQIFIDELNQDTPVVNYTSDYARALKAYVDAQTRVLLQGADPQTELDAAAEQVAQATGRTLAE